MSFGVKILIGLATGNLVVIVLFKLGLMDKIANWINKRYPVWRG